MTAALYRELLLNDLLFGNMQKLPIYVIWILLIHVSLLNQAQTLEDQFKRYSESEVGEQVHLHLSESIVGAGEAIWFQATITNTDSAGDLSRVVYLELFNRQEEVVAQGIYQASYGIAPGQLMLPDSLAGGWYQLQAYTQYMRNGYSANYFSQPILVINTDLSNPSPKNNANEATLQLFPEGGNWIADQENNVVALVSADYSGEGQLEVLQEADSSIVARAVVNNWLGEFSFTPLADTSYVARFITSDTTYHSVPNVQSDNHFLQVSIAGNTLEIDGQAGTEGTVLAIRSDNELLHYQPVDQAPFSLRLPVAAMRGLTEVAVLNAQAKVITQRLVYLSASNNDFSLNVSAQTVSPRQEVNVALNPNVNVGQTELSVTVRKLHFPTYPLSVASLDHFGLSEVLLPEGVSARQAPQWINRWLVTQTSPWPRWSDMLAKKSRAQPFVQEDEMLLITGKVETSHPFNEDDRILLSIPGDDPYFEYSSIGQGGEFAILVSRVYGSQSSILQYQSATDDQPQNIQWTIDSVFAASPPNFIYPSYSFSDDEWQQIVDGYQLRRRVQQTYYDLEEETDPSAQHKRQFRFYGAPNIRVDPDDYISLPSFEEICRELLPGVRLTKKKKKYDFDVFDPGSRKFLPNEPTLFLDGVPIQDKDYIINFPPDQISYIETVNRRTYYGNVRLDGVIAIYTQQERAYEEALSGRALFTSLPFYTSSTGFSPPDSLSSTMPDFRTLLFWRPKVNPGSDKDFSFSASDELGTYEVIVRGMTKSGRLIQGRTTFEVKPDDLP